MTSPLNTFATQTASIPLSQLDANFTYVNGKIVSVKDYGAVGDGVTDDTAAIQAAITAAGAGGAVYFPPVATFYKCSSGLTIANSGVTLFGLGGGGFGSSFSGGAHIKFDSGVATGITISGTGQLYGVNLRDLKITLLSTTGKAIYVDRCVELGFTRLDLWNASAAANTATAIYLDATTPDSNTRWTGLVRLYGVRTSWFNCGLKATSDNYVTSVAVTACCFLGQTPSIASSIGIDGLGGGSFVGNATDVEGWDIGIKAGAIGVLAVVGARFEANTTSDVTIVTATNCFIANNSHSGATAGVCVVCPSAYKSRNHIEAINYTAAGKSIVSKGSYDFNNEQWISGRKARNEVYNLADSSTPIFVTEVWGAGSALTNVFGESVTAKETDISGSLWPLKVGSGDTLALYAGNAARLSFNASTGAGTFTNARVDAMVTQTPPDAVTRTPLCASGNWQVFNYTAASPATGTIGVPTNPVTGMDIDVTIKNATGGALTITWDSVYKMSTWTDPANGKSRSVRFRYNGTNWIQISMGVDVPN